MNQQAFSALATMMNSFSTGREDIELRLKTLEKVLADLPDAVVIETARRFTTGEVEGQNRSFAPSVAEFTQEAKRIHELKAAIARPRIAWTGPKPNDRAPFLIAQEKYRAKYAGWEVLKDNVNYDQFRAMSIAKQIPAGATWVAALGNIYIPGAAA